MDTARKYNTGVSGIDFSKYNFDPDNIDIKRLSKEDRAALEQEFQNLNLSNSFIFSKTMEDPKIAKDLLEEILNISINKAVYNEEEKTLKEQYFDKGVRFDVYINDDKGTIYNVEMQAADTDDLPGRSRYYQGNIDTNALKAGKLYRDLKDSYIIFICCFDLFKKDSFIYTFTNKCKEYPEIDLQDGSTKIFLNTKGRKGNISQSLLEFLCYVENSTDKFARISQSGLVREIHGKVKQIKETNKLGGELYDYDHKRQNQRRQGKKRRLYHRQRRGYYHRQGRGHFTGCG
ncbi:MAG: Rpn family recombination-promoting nuclease/putative transposase [Clostridiales bacterium]|nr:Rpn family recombination-promoting nuclease/putative transposase [Clostridiales bacterium]